jgi:hypothetical protein
MNTKKVWLIALAFLAIGAGMAIAQDTYASTDDAYQIGFIQGQADYNQRRSVDTLVGPASTSYANKFLNTKGFSKTSQAYKTIKAAFENGYRAGWAEAKRLREN